MYIKVLNLSQYYVYLILSIFQIIIIFKNQISYDINMAASAKKSLTQHHITHKSISSKMHWIAYKQLRTTYRKNV